MSGPAPVPVLVTGVAGRMGLLIARGAALDDRCALAGATVRPGSYADGEDLGALAGAGPSGVKVCTQLEAAAAAAGGTPVVIDFTSPAALFDHVEVARARKLPLVVGTTGLADDHHAALDEAAREVPVLEAANTSLGANLLAALVARAAAALPEADIEIFELHHRAKKDSPSGTAILLGRAAAEARGQSWSEVAVPSRAGHAPRQPGTIGVFGLRGGTVPGEHTVTLFLDDERVELAHKVQDRSIFARGALTAARFLAGQAPGRYTMADVLGL